MPLMYVYFYSVNGRFGEYAVYAMSRKAADRKIKKEIGDEKFTFIRRDRW